MTQDPKPGDGETPEGGEAGRPRGRSGRPRRAAKAKPEKRGGSVEERKEDRLKRLLDLVVLLLNAREPVPFTALAEQFEAYQGKGPSALRTFERDTPDADGVRYASVVASPSGGALGVGPWLLPTYAFLKRIAGDNDGVVPVSSQARGEVLGHIECRSDCKHTHRA